MPSLAEVMDFICRCAEQTGHSFEADFAEAIEQKIRRQWPAERVYIAPADSRKDPARAQAIREAAKRLPTGVVAQRFGVSRQWVSQATRKK